MYRFKYITIICSLLGVLFSACYDDKGNYTYHELDEITIDTTDCGMLPAYVVSRFESLTIEPKVYYNGQLANNNSEAPLDYLWTFYIASTGAGLDYTIDTLGHECIFNAELSRPAGSYTLQLTVTNRETGLQSYFTVPFSIEESITAGWMMLYECADEPGTSDVGLVVNNLVKKNIITDKEFWDLYAASSNHHIEGNPVRILHTVMAMPNDLVIVATNQNLVGADNNNFSSVLEFDDFFYESPATRNIVWYGATGVAKRGEMLINDNKVYTNTANMMSRDTFFGVPRSGEHGELAPWGSDVLGNSYNTVVYDQTNQCFLCTNSSSIEFTSFAGQDLTACEFDVNNVGMNLLMGDWGRNYYDYMLMSQGDERYLAVANFNTTNSSSQNIGLYLYNISASPEIRQATSMSAAYGGEFILYGAGSKVYNLKYNNSTTAEVLWEAPSADEEVVCVRLQKFHFNTLYIAMMPNRDAILHIATWNETTQEGKLYQYRINSADGSIQSEPREYTVPGKVKDMGWKYILEM